MKQRLVLLLVLLSAAFWCHAQIVVATTYTSDAIPEVLKKDANAVYRLDEGILEVLSPSKYVLSVHQVVTILNAEGAEHLRCSLAFDKFNKVADVEVNVFNNSGVRVHKYTKADFTVQNYYDGISLASDDKIMRLTAAATGYPCTIETKYVINTTGYIDLPNWYMNNASDAIEQFRYIVKVPVQQDIRYATSHLDVEPVITSAGGQKTYMWETKNVAVQKLERDSYESGTYLPQVKVAPTSFEYDGYKGTFRNWNDFGQWCFSLYDEKKPFSEQRVEEIKALVSNVPDVAGKVALLYDYLKKNMRYVSIQFGIGGYKPFASRFVDENKYGDCKALTNYMRNLLGVAGIRSYPALVNAGYNKYPVRADFPENSFNHVILCVPNGRDSIWLECTSNNSDPNFLGNFTENRNALLLTEAGGVLIMTPASDYTRNTLTTTTHIVLDDAGAAMTTLQLNSTGGCFELLDAISQLEEQKQSEAFIHYFGLKQPDAFKLAQAGNTTAAHAWTLQAEYEKLHDFKAGSKYFYPVGLASLCPEKPELATRKMEYLFSFPYKKSDTTVFHLPQGFSVNALPRSTQLQAPQVSYRRDVKSDTAAHTVTVISTLVLRNHVITPDAYKEVAAFFDNIKHLEAEKLILEQQAGF